MMRLGLATACLLVLLALSGCVAQSQTDSGSSVPSDIQTVAVTDDTGAIRGIVVTASITPIPDAVVKVSGANLTSKTSATGGFSFSGLKAGTYFVSAAKPGYQTTQTSTTVMAGDAEPPVLKILLADDLANRPFGELLQWKGFLQCGFNLLAASINPCLFTGSDNVHQFPFGGNRTPDFTQLEASWEGTQPAGNWLDLILDGSETNCKGINSESPATINITAEAQAECNKDAKGFQVRLFPGSQPGTPPVPTVVLNQEYKIFMSYFYGFQPRAGWTFVKDGECTTPQQCAAPA